MTDITEHRIGFLNVLGAQQVKLMRQPLLRVGLGLLALLMVALSTGPQVLRMRDPGREISFGADLGSELLMAVRTGGDAALAGLLLVVLAGASMTQEYRWRSLHLWLGSGVPRRRFLWTKFAALSGVALLIPTIAALAAAPGTALFIYVAHGSVEFSVSGMIQMLSSIPIAAYTLLPYVALAILLAVWGRSPVAAIGGGLAFVFLGEGLLLHFVAMSGETGLAVARHFPTHLAHSLVVGEGGRLPPVGRSVAAILILIYVLTLLGICTAVLERQDLAE